MTIVQTIEVTDGNDSFPVTIYRCDDNTLSQIHNKYYASSGKDVDNCYINNDGYLEYRCTHCWHDDIYAAQQAVSKYIKNYNFALKKDKNELMTVEEYLDKLAYQLDMWANDSVNGGWSTYQAKPMREEADKIRRFLAEKKYSNVRNNL